ncbi:MAG: flavodoxin-dependent (E)-4-hydroxy-3-methylbut-2-enyl-diphosphate synthase [Helicobacteraceae bacterium]|jgi:(E)-4-hydroxy-3-methylbut-2-enyl-diphosphate synthase|nr:flavodoxin-dependent (E)-4-hydroxy-3-methylbut-2-enyl-diphosphate synthase [Helicobacteraceae bacterium]
MISRYPTKQIFVGKVAIGADAPISAQSMTFSKTSDVQATLDQIKRLYFAGADIVRVSIPDEQSANALKEIKAQSPLPIVADIHFNYRLALKAAECVDCIRINPGNIGAKSRIKEVARLCKERDIPIRIGVNSGSLEKEIEAKYANGAEGMVQSALYHIKLLEDLDFTAIKVSMKASDAARTVEAYRMLRPLTPYPFHLGLTEAGTTFHATIKSSIALGALLLEGIGDTMRVSITGELEEEIRVARAILQDSGRQKEGVNIVSCPTCARLEADLKSAVTEIEKRVHQIKTPLNLSIMGCAVNALGEAKHADAAIAFGKKNGLVIVRGETIGKYPENELVDRFMQEVYKLEKDYKST